MSKKLTEDQIKWILSVDSSEAQSSIHKLISENKNLERANRERRQEMIHLEKQGLKESEAYKNLNKVMKENDSRLRENKLMIAGLEKQIGLTNLTMAQLKKRAQELQRQLDNTVAATHPEDYKTLQKELLQTRSRMDELSFAGKKTKETLGDVIQNRGAVATFIGNLYMRLADMSSRALKDLFALSKQMQGDSARSTIVLGDHLGYVSEQAEKLAKKMGVTNREFVAMTAGTADLLVPLDISREKAAQMAVQVQSLAGALNEWTGGRYGVEEISRRLTKSMLGEAESLKELGISIRLDSEEYKELVKQKQRSQGVTTAQAQALAILDMLYKKSADAQAAYNREGNNILRTQNQIVVAWKNVQEKSSSALMGMIGWALEHRAAIIPVAAAVITYQGAILLANASASMWNTTLKIGSSLSAINRVVVLSSAVAYNTLTGSIVRAAAAKTLLTTAMGGGIFMAGIAAVVAAGAVAYALLHKRVKETSVILEANNRITEAVNGQYGETEAKVRSLSAIIENSNLTLDERNEAILKLKEIMPEYNGLIDQEGKLIGHSTAAIGEYLTALKEKIYLEANMEELSSAYRKRRAAELAMEKAEAMTGPTGGAMMGYTYHVTEKQKALDAAKNELDLTDAIIQKLMQEREKRMALSKSTGGQEEQTLDLIEAKRKELEAAEKVTATTEAELIAKNRKIASIKEDIKRLEGLGVPVANAQKNTLSLILSELDNRFAESVTGLKKFRIETNQSEASYNADLRQQEAAHYQARIALLAEYRKKVKDPAQLAEIDKMLSDAQNSLLDTQIKQRAVVEKLLLDANPIDKEKAAYDERLREVGLFGIQKEELTEEQLKALELLQSQHAQNLAAIQKASDAEEERNRKEAFEERFSARKQELDQQINDKAAQVEGQNTLGLLTPAQAFENESLLHQMKIDALREELDVRRQMGLETTQIQESLADSERKFTLFEIGEMKRRMDVYNAVAGEMGTKLGEYIAGSEESLAEMGVYLLRFGLDMLKKQLQLAAAQAMGWSLASPESILTLGAAGIAKGLAIQALIEGVFAMASAAIGGSGGKSSGSSLSDSPQGTTVKGYESGGFIRVNRESDGKPYDASFEPKRRGFVNRPTVLVGDGPMWKTKEFVVSGDAVNNPTIRPIIDLIDRAQRGGLVRDIDFRSVIAQAMPGLEDGGYTAKTPERATQGAGTRDNDPDEQTAILLRVLKKLESEGVYIKYGHIQNAEARYGDILKNVSKKR